MKTIPSADSTILNLLTRDGVVSVEFSPPLDSQQYVELFDIAKDFDSEALVREKVTDAAKRWGCTVTV